MNSCSPSPDWVPTCGLLPLEVEISIHLRSVTLGSTIPILPLHRIWFSLPQCLARSLGDFWLTSVLDESECLSG